MISESDYVQLDAVAQAELVRRGELSATELLEAAIQRAERLNPRLNAIVIPMYEIARARAREPLQGPLAGVPFLLKDLFQDYAGVLATSGSRALRRAGAVPDGTSTLRRPHPHVAVGLVLAACCSGRERSRVRAGGPDDVKLRTVPLLAAGAMAVVTWSTASRAAGSVQPPPPRAEVAPHVVYRHPNSSLLGKGVFAFIGAYFPSVLVAIVNDNSYDKRLYLPVLGPWLDLADRPGCGGPGQSTCGAETAFKILLIASGAAQGFGAVAVVLGLALPERIVPQTTPLPQARGLKLRVLPAALGRGGYGMQAVGTF